MTKHRKSWPAWDHAEAFRRFRVRLADRPLQFQRDVLHYYLGYLDPLRGPDYLNAPKRKKRPPVAMLRRIIIQMEHRVSDKELPNVKECLLHHITLECADSAAHTCKFHP